MAVVHQGRSDAETRVWDARDVREWDESVRVGDLPVGGIGWASFIGWRAFRRVDEDRPSEFRTVSWLGFSVPTAPVSASYAACCNPPI